MTLGHIYIEAGEAVTLQGDMIDQLRLPGQEGTGAGSGLLEGGTGTGVEDGGPAVFPELSQMPVILLHPADWTPYINRNGQSLAEGEHRLPLMLQRLRPML